MHEYADHVRILAQDDPQLAQEIADFHGIENVLLWMQSKNLPNPPFDLVAQDEFNYDFLVEFEPQGRWLAFGVT